MHLAVELPVPDNAPCFLRAAVHKRRQSDRQSPLAVRKLLGHDHSCTGKLAVVHSLEDIDTVIAVE